jgi:hypothetical protein
MGIFNIIVAYQFIKLLTTPWKEQTAYKLGVIDDTGKVIKKKEDRTSEDKKAFTIFHVLIFNIKKIMEKFPFGKTRLASFAAALYLLKEQAKAEGGSAKLMEARLLTHLKEQKETLLECIETNSLHDYIDPHPGTYQVLDELHCEGFELNKGDEVILTEENINNPLGECLGITIYEATQTSTGNKVVISHANLQ